LGKAFIDPKRNKENLMLRSGNRAYLVYLFSIMLLFLVAGPTVAQGANSESWRTSQNLGRQGTQPAFFDNITDWFEDLFGDDERDYEENPASPFFWDRYGMNCHHIDAMSVQDFERVMKNAGPWLRIGISTDEVAEENWRYRLEPALQNIRQAGINLGISPRVVIGMGDYSIHSQGSDRLLQSLSWQEKANRYHNLAATLVAKVRSLGFNDAIFEAWNEPDNTPAGIGIGPDPDSQEFEDALAIMAYGFAAGVHQAGGLAAFPPLMSMNGTKFDLIRNLWQRVGSSFDYFSVHMYDDEPDTCKSWSIKTRKLIGDTPVIITEHGFQHHKKDAQRYRAQAWAFLEGFSNGSNSNLHGVMGYVYRSDDGAWEIFDDEDFFWAVTHDNRP
jgi:hypothetical protein